MDHAEELPVEAGIEGPEVPEKPKRQELTPAPQCRISRQILHLWFGSDTKGHRGDTPQPCGVA
jgi:hypothetical protein